MLLERDRKRIAGDVGVQLNFKLLESPPPKYAILEWFYAVCASEIRLQILDYLAKENTILVFNAFMHSFSD